MFLIPLKISTLSAERTLRYARELEDMVSMERASSVVICCEARYSTVVRAPHIYDRVPPPDIRCNVETALLRMAMQRCRMRT